MDSPKEKYYDTVYFDSDEEEAGSTSLEEKRRQRLPDEALLYDPKGDEGDEAWVAEQIKKTMPKESRNKNTVAKTDAILSCPMCFTPLCFSCQRHESYTNQFRAMFVTNCQVNRKERFRYAPPKTGNKVAVEDVTPNEGYYIVKCETCDTHVAMMDEEEVYHFFNVIAS